MAAKKKFVKFLVSIFHGLEKNPVNYSEGRCRKKFGKTNAFFGFLIYPPPPPLSPSSVRWKGHNSQEKEGRPEGGRRRRRRGVTSCGGRREKGKEFLFFTPKKATKDFFFVICRECWEPVKKSEHSKRKTMGEGEGSTRHRLPSARASSSPHPTRYINSSLLLT